MAGKKRKPVKHIGFKGAVAAVVKQGKSQKAAQAIIAAGARGASPAAKAANPRLKKVVSKRQRTAAATRAKRGSY